jgi:hypothetical protein
VELEIADYPSIIGTKVEIRADEAEGGKSHGGLYTKVRGFIRKEIRDVNGGRYYVIEPDNSTLKHRFLIVKEKFMGDSIPREFSRGAREVLVGIALVLDEALLQSEVFDFKEVDYFATGDIRPIQE